MNHVPRQISQIHSRIAALEASPKVQIKLLHDNAQVPQYASANAAGMDVFTPVDIDLMSDEKKLVQLGFEMSIPVGWEAQIRPRSGLALKYSVTVLNSPGTIDADYRGPVGVLLINWGPLHFSAKKGERIAQMVIARAPQAKIIVVDNLGETARGKGGFGSTGK